MNKSDEKIIKAENGTEAVTISEEFLIALGLHPGSDVELFLDKHKKWIVMRPAGDSDDMVARFKEAMDSLA